VDVWRDKRRSVFVLTDSLTYCFFTSRDGSRHRKSLDLLRESEVVSKRAGTVQMDTWFNGFAVRLVRWRAYAVEMLFEISKGC